MAACRPSHLAVQTVHGNAERGIDELRRLDHVVLLVAAQAVLWTERGREPQVAECGNRVERVRQVGGDRGRVGEQCDPAARERPAQVGLGEQPIETEAHHSPPASGSKAPSTSGCSSGSTKPSR